MSNKPHVGKCLAVWMKIKNKRNKDLAEHFGCHPQMIQIWKGREDHKFHKMIDFADYFNVSVFDFMSKSDEINKS